MAGDGRRDSTFHERGRPGPSANNRSGGVPDGMLLGGLALVLALALFSWSATGLGGFFVHGTWPDGVTFGNTPKAMSALATQPHDIAAAWPGTPPRQLSGYGLFWGLFISQVLVVIVLAVFVLGTLTRARAVRAARREQTRDAAGPALTKPSATAPATPEPAPTAPTPSAPAATEAQPDAAPASPAPAPPAVLSATPTAPPGPYTRVLDAPGAALVTTRDPRLWAETKDARAKLGPVHLFDPTHLCDTPSRLRWSPHDGCDDRTVAAARAAAMLEPLRSPRPIDAELHNLAETLLRCWLHAAALGGKQFREVHRWAQSASSDAVRILRSRADAGAGTAGELEAALTGHPERRATATELVRRALSPMSQLHVRNSCNATRADRVALDSFIHETGTLYVVGESPEIMPILTALTHNVRERARRTSTAGPLTPPLTEIWDLPSPPR